MNKMDNKLFDQDYFEDYDSFGNHYNDVAFNHTAPVHRLRKIYDQFGLTYPNNMIDLGAATGVLLNEVENQFPECQTKGIEISDWAVSNKVNKNVEKGDVFDLLENPDQTYDLILVNMLVYLTEPELEEFMLKLLRLMHENTVIIPVVLYYEDNHAECVYHGKGMYKVGTDKLPVLARPKYWWQDKLTYPFNMDIFYEEEPALFLKKTEYNLEKSFKIEHSISFDIDELEEEHTELHPVCQPVLVYFQGVFQATDKIMSYRFFLAKHPGKDCWVESGGPVVDREEAELREYFLPYLVKMILGGYLGRIRKAEFRNTDFYGYVRGAYIFRDKFANQGEGLYLVETDNLM